MERKSKIVKESKRAERERKEMEKKKLRKSTAFWEHGWRMRLARCLSPLNSKLSPVGRGYSWMGDHLGIASC